MHIKLINLDCKLKFVAKFVNIIYVAKTMNFDKRKMKKKKTATDNT